MTTATLIALAAFAFVSSITPGPNNMMLLASGANFGFRRSIAHMLGISIGFGVMIVAVGFGLNSLFAAYPPLYTVIQIVGVAYLLYLAYRIATADGIGDGKTRAAPMTFLGAAAFQWVNVKAWAMAITSITLYAAGMNLYTGVLIVAGVFMVINLPCIAIWTSFGTVLRRFLTRPALLRTFNVVMAVLLVASLYPMIEDFKLPF